VVNGQAVNAKLDPDESKGAAGCMVRYTSHRLYVRDADPKVLGNQHSGAPFVRVREVFRPLGAVDVLYNVAAKLSTPPFTFPLSTWRRRLLKRLEKNF